MKTRLLTGTLGAMLFFSPYMFAQDDQKPSPTRSTRTERRASESRDSGMSRDMREAIAWERAKDRAAERQARIEARHPNREYNADRVRQNADRDDQTPGRRVKDTKAPGARKDQ